MLVRLPRLDVTRLAADFSAAVRAAHSDLELRAIRDRNEAETDPDIDHVWDYTDTGQLMADAVALQIPGNPDISDFDEEMRTAWARAKETGFRLSRILVACEWSGMVRDAFAARGHDATSCDVLPSDQPGKHYQGDARDVLGDGYHVMVAFPPCTYLCNSGVKHLVRGGRRIDPPRWDAMREGAEFFRDLGEAPIDKIARENPIMHKYAREIVGRGADQYVQVHDFGDDASKRTGLWLDNLPELEADPADYVEPRIIEYPKGSGRMVKRWANQSPCGADKRGPSADRGHLRGKTYAGIAKAMAETWGGIREALRRPAQQLATVHQMELAL